MTICSKCGTQVDDGIKFCSNCGADLSMADAFTDEPAPVVMPNIPPLDKTEQELPPASPAQPEDKKEKKEKKHKEPKEPKPEIPRKDRRLSICSLISLICGLVGAFAGAFGCIFTFVSLTYAIIFYAFSVLAIIFGLIAVLLTKKGSKYKGRGIAITGIVLGVAFLLFWIIVSIVLKGQVYLEYGTTDLMSLFRKLADLSAAKN